MLLVKNGLSSRSASSADDELPISKVNVVMGEKIFIKCVGYS